MVHEVCVVGAGRVGSATRRAAWRSAASTAGASDGSAELVLLCVPDRAIATWRAHDRRRGRGSPTSAARRRSPRSTPTGGGSACTRSRRSRERGARAARRRVRGRHRRDPRGARASAFELARTLGLRAVRARRRRPAALPRRRRDRVQLPRHALPRRRGALRGRRARRPRRSSRSCGGRSRTASSSPGPIARGDWETVEAHLATRSRRARPQLEPLYARPRRDDATRAPREGSSRDDRTIGELRRARAARASGDDRARADDGRASTRVISRSSAPRAESATSSSRASSSTRRSSRPARTSRATRATRQRDAALAEERGVDFLFAPSAEEIYPPGFQTWVDVEELRAAARGRAPPGPLPRRRDRLPEALQHRPPAPRLLRPEGRAAGRRS